MNIDWITIVATFGAAIAGSWFGSRATHAQTRVNIQLERNRWLRERCFEFLEVTDEFINVSFRKDALELHQRDRLHRKLNTLATIALPNQQNEIGNKVQEVRKLHVGQKCSLQFSDVEQFFGEIQKRVRATIKQLEG